LGQALRGGELVAIEETIDTLQRVVDRAMSGRESPKVLDAGCGAELPYLSFGAGTRLVGMDVSRAQLDRNDRLDEKLVGDIQTSTLPGDLDAVVCWNVIEHLPRPDLALANFARSVRPGGIIVIRTPNVFSVKGLITKLTPHRFHVWVYRVIRHDEQAGRDDRPPFRTHLKLSMSPAVVRRFAASNGLRVAYFALFESRAQRAFRHERGLEGGLWRIVTRAVDIASLGFISADLTEYCIVLQKGPDGDP
jgi:SAM-dependent methyltransferase